jgi:small conductance mechanosensitive channel
LQKCERKKSSNLIIGALLTIKNYIISMTLTDIFGFETKEIIGTISDKLNFWFEAAISNLPNLVLAIIILVLAIFVAKLGRKFSAKYIQKLGANPTISKFLGQLFYFSIIVLAIMLALSVMDLSKTVSSILAGLGILGLALGFAFQDTAANFISGIYITFNEPYKLGDIIETKDGHEGTVIDISLRITKVLNYNGQVVHIPNRYLFQEYFVNYTEFQKRRIQVACGVSYGEDLEHIERVALEAMRGLKSRIMEEEPTLFWTEFGDSSINFTVNIWADFKQGQLDFIPVRNEAIKSLKKAFDAEGIMIPFPIRTLDFGIKGGVNLKEEISEMNFPSNSK